MEGSATRAATAKRFWSWFRMPFNCSKRLTEACKCQTYNKAGFQGLGLYVSLLNRLSRHLTFFGDIHHYLHRFQSSRSANPDPLARTAAVDHLLRLNIVDYVLLRRC